MALLAERTRRRRKRRGAAAVTAVVVVAVSAGVIATNVQSASPVRVETRPSAPPPEAAVAPTRPGQLPLTKTLLVWAGPRPSELTIANLDAGTVTTLTLKGVPRAYDQVSTVGKRLIVLTNPDYPNRIDGQAYAFAHVPPRPGESAVVLGPATDLAASNDGRGVWLETAHQQIREVDVATGRTLVSARSVPGRLDAALSNGLLIEAAANPGHPAVAPGLSVWNPQTGAQHQIGAGLVPQEIAAHASVVAWVGDDCDCLHLTDVTTWGDQKLTLARSDPTATNAGAFNTEGHHADFSLDGRWLLIGVVPGRAKNGAPIFRIGVIHTGSDAVGYLGPPSSTEPLQPPVWSPDDNWAFFTFGGNLDAWHVGDRDLIPLRSFYPQAAVPST